MGFNEENYKSFNTYATDFKKMLGCKGVGRMTWLKAFSNVQIESTYNCNDKCYKRFFKFDRDNAVNSDSNILLDEVLENTTTVRFVGIKSKYKASTPKKLTTIARDILNHCFVYFVLGKAPEIVVSDDTDSISINNMFDDIENENILTQQFKVGDHLFELIHFKNYNPNSNMQGYCIKINCICRKIIRNGEKQFS